MLRTSSFLMLAAAALIALLSACDQAPPEGSEQSQAAPTSEADSQVARDIQESLAEGKSLSEAISESLPEEAGSRTPAPTPTPGPVTEMITEIARETGLASRSFLGRAAQDWLNLGVSVLYVLLAYLAATLLIRTIMVQFVRRTRNSLDDEVLQSIGSSLRWIFVILALQPATMRLEFLGPGQKSFMTDIYFILGLAIGLRIAWSLVSFAGRFTRARLELKQDNRNIDPVVSLLQRVIWGFILLIGLTILLSHFGLNVTALSAALGLAGLALSLAAKDTLADAISGLIILADRPFRVGDRIEIQELDTWGDVVDIGLRTTRIHTTDNCMVIVPNSNIGKSQVVNFSLPDPRYRLETHVYVKYGTDLEKVRRTIIETVRKVDGVLLDKPVEALYAEMGQSVMTFLVRWWIESYIDTRPMYDRVNTALQKAMTEAGAAAYPAYPLYNINLLANSDHPVPLPTSSRNHDKSD